jgi:hypothetical protein
VAGKGQAQIIAHGLAALSRALFRSAGPSLGWPCYRGGCWGMRVAFPVVLGCGCSTAALA